MSNSCSCCSKSSFMKYMSQSELVILIDELKKELLEENGE